MMSTGLAVAAVAAVFLVTLPAIGTSLTTFGKSATTAPYAACPQEKFDCHNGVCITGSHWCDGIDNCGNNADELSCRICLSGSLKCKASNQCVPSGARCNGIMECLDESDELGCELVEKQQKTNGASTMLLSMVVLLPTVVIWLMGQHRSH